jgi:lysophospholipase L1-like esterase
LARRIEMMKRGDSRSHNDFRVCFVGDSITLGTLDPLGLGWPGRLYVSAVGRGKAFTMYNLGVRGDTSEDVARRWFREVSNRLVKGPRSGVVFSFGLNDSLADQSGAWRVQPERLTTNARAILTRAARRWPVLVVGPAPVDDTRPPPRSPNDGGPIWLTSNVRIAEVNQRISSVAEALRIPYLELFHELASDPKWLAAMAESDSVHPSGGYALIADRVAQWPAWRTLLELGAKS